MAGGWGGLVRRAGGTRACGRAVSLLLAMPAAEQATHQKCRIAFSSRDAGGGLGRRRGRTWRANGAGCSCGGRARGG
eukprot:14110238-Alexandrium_andersonii.AAC.1